MYCIDHNIRGIIEELRKINQISGLFPNSSIYLRLIMQIDDPIEETCNSIREYNKIKDAITRLKQFYPNSSIYTFITIIYSVL